MPDVGVGPAAPEDVALSCFIATDAATSMSPAAARSGRSIQVCIATVNPSRHDRTGEELKCAGPHALGTHFAVERGGHGCIDSGPSVRYPVGYKGGGDIALYTEVAAEVTPLRHAG